MRVIRPSTFSKGSQAEKEISVSSRQVSTEVIQEEDTLIPIAIPSFGLLESSNSTFGKNPSNKLSIDEICVVALSLFNLAPHEGTSQNSLWGVAARFDSISQRS